MAVKAPNPPTLPTPPTVPGVTLSEGGSVTQSNAPPANGTTSKSTDNEKQMEEQAKEAVVNGSGGLSRTTHKNPTAEAKAAREAQQSGQNQAQATIDTGRSQAAQAANLGGSGGVPQENGRNLQGQETEAASLQANPAPKFDYQGLTYWLPMLVAAFVAAALLVKKFLHRQGRKGELTRADIEADVLGAVDSRELRGLTPDEVLARLAVEEQPPPTRPTAPARPAKLKPKEAASVPKAKKKPPAPARAKAPEEERKHFEVRI
ncbi:hypothetical protein [Selenomonas sp. AB3002]|uniref:hypothetical protein n=1 Tax=Selenomonas sp. AB3002 TaxID=1392502 RepID=UPI0004959368